MSDEWFDGETYDAPLDQTRLSSSLALVLTVLEGTDQWWTLEALAGEVSTQLDKAVSEAGISARLRDLRKERFGGHDIEARRISDSGLWEYRLNSGDREQPPTTPPTPAPPPKVVPRTRENPLRRKKIICTTTVGKNSMRLTCPRCGWPCTHLVIPYYETQWAEHGGICCECCNEAAAYHDRVGWPARRDASLVVGDTTTDTPVI